MARHRSQAAPQTLQEEGLSRQSAKVPPKAQQVEQEDSDEYDSYSYDHSKEASEQGSDQEWQYARSPKGTKIKYSFKTGQVRKASPSPDNPWVEFSFPDGRKAEIH